MKDDHRIPKAVCPKCGYRMDCTTHAYGNQKPKEGDISMCLSCGHLAKFNADLSMREPTADEAREMSLRPDVIEAQLVRDHFVYNKILNRIRPHTGTSDSTGHGQPL